jgi:hypothetical protein
MKRHFSILLLLQIAVLANAQLRFDGQYRSRGEVRNGFKQPLLDNQEPAAFIEHRARLKASHQTDKIGFGLSIQDVRIWGETGQINKSDQLLSVHEAYADFYATERSTFRVGRQEMIYDDHRLIGNLDWAMQARAFDAIRYMYKNDKGLQFDLMASWNQEGYGDGIPEPAKLSGNNYSIATGGGSNTRIFNLNLPKNQLMAFFKKNFKSGDLSLTLLRDLYNSNDSTTETHSDITIALSPNYKSGDIRFGAQFYYTGGAAGKTFDATTGNYEKIKLSGYFVNLYIQHTGIVGKPLIGVDYVSGDDSSTGDKVEGWAPKYGTNHKFYGFMDFFYVGSQHGGADARSAGLIDLYLKTDFSLSEKTKLMAHLHQFWSAEGRVNVTDDQTYKGGLATELDLVASHTLTPGVSLQIGFSHMLGISETMKQLKFSNPDQEMAKMPNWTWVMLAFTPNFN